MSVQDGQGLGLSGSASVSARNVIYSRSTNAPNRQHGVTWSAGNFPCWTTFFSSSKKTFNAWHEQWHATFRCNVW